MTNDQNRKPSQFRLPEWAADFLAHEASATGQTKTEVLVEALEAYKTTRTEELMAEGYREIAAWQLEEVREWDPTLADGLEDDSW